MCWRGFALPWAWLPGASEPIACSLGAIFFDRLAAQSALEKSENRLEVAGMKVFGMACGRCRTHVPCGLCVATPVGTCGE
jgi:hypothetical protein